MSQTILLAIGVTAGSLFGLGLLVIAVVLTVRQRKAREQPAYPRYTPKGRAARWARSKDEPTSQDHGSALPTDHDQSDTIWRLAAGQHRPHRHR
ncbi:hypothetical protein EV191_108257 [Tamaricihabitans halophyticus]|uniref:Uncharacterized protein n=1 Tax=Tamaricihabitans halophyticus TaxID=1262583 RepID=A0A4R2QLC8_9PSEU|nr:hypothetical protein [Tamaricihabitans halophyticus]TCP50167.1 hypothetical protein EV191_108257 [Tamaricihabitans halophyticus]